MIIGATMAHRDHQPLRRALGTGGRLLEKKRDWYAKGAEQRQITKIIYVGPELCLVVETTLRKRKRTQQRTLWSSVKPHLHGQLVQFTAEHPACTR